ncbi:cupin domain-containing protein [Fictibacillus barbaricus]|uniref:Cupin domain-containing protein n=1 Tax=Fictibacillus barbaricus TaxID=182136 RepID=A0ABS2ZF51_9BACL|nr:cupin domain-containing protein [Fictibacillus barbaricus]MBN3545360.1 cupin domain-containing protein [Fictibacillus barbaricus]GGB59627.1 cupin [Fictibacillus barbaricus]
MSKISTLNAEHYHWGDACDGWHLLKQDNLSIIHEKMPPQSAEVRHYHVFSHQFFFLLNGELVIEKDGEETTIHPHQGIAIPAGIPHQVRNESQMPAEFLVTSQPPAHGDRVVVKKVKSISHVTL